MSIARSGRLRERQANPGIVIAMPGFEKADTDWVLCPGPQSLGQLQCLCDTKTGDDGNCSSRDPHLGCQNFDPVPNHGNIQA